MTVLHTVASIRTEHGGPSRSVPGLVAALVREGVDARLHVADRNGLMVAPVRANLVHDHGLWLPSNHAAARSARRTGVPLVVSVRGMLEPWALAHRRWKKRTAWTLYQRADLSTAALLHATGEAEAASIRRSGLRAPIGLIPNGIDVPAELPARTHGPVRRALFLSRMHPVKGLPLLIEAWARVRPADWELLIAGPDEDGHRAHVEALSSTAGLTDTVSFAGPVSDADKWALYRTADLFVLPSHSENFGLVVAEALAAGVPVLTTTGAPWHALETEGCGWWTEPTAEAIAGALREATDLPRAVLNAMGERGHSYVVEALAWAHVARKMGAVYDWILQKGPRPACVHLP